MSLSLLQDFKTCNHVNIFNKLCKQSHELIHTKMGKKEIYYFLMKRLSIIFKSLSSHGHKLFSILHTQQDFGSLMVFNDNMVDD